jgi:mono/diheme cytochrome c family protein
VEAPTTAPTIEAPTAETPVEAAAEEEFNAEAAYNWACAGCHGVDGQGVEGFGSNLFFSVMVMGRDTTALFDLLTIEQPPANPEEGFVHPYRGGNPELDNEQIRALIDYVYSLTGG